MIKENDILTLCSTWYSTYFETSYSFQSICTIFMALWISFLKKHKKKAYLQDVIVSFPCVTLKFPIVWDIVWYYMVSQEISRENFTQPCCHQFLYLCSAHHEGVCPTSLGNVGCPVTVRQGARNLALFLCSWGAAYFSSPFLLWRQPYVTYSEEEKGYHLPA